MANRTGSTTATDLGLDDIFMADDLDPEKQIDALKLFMGEQFDVEVTDEVFEPGQPISITLGKLSGFEGEVVKHKGKKKVIIRLNHITHSILVTLPKEHIAPRTKPLK